MEAVTFTVILQYFSLLNPFDWQQLTTEIVFCRFEKVITDADHASISF
jgi:hypothetical protein